MRQIILFDLDGTLLDTARDFAYAINLMLRDKKRPPLNFDLFREQVHGESTRMIEFAFDIAATHSEFEALRQTFLETYCLNCSKKTVFFDGIPELLATLDEKKMPWGIVTSKPTWIATPVLDYFGLQKRAACVVMGDTLSKKKPDPAPLFYACEQVLIAPQQAIYVGDLQTDIIAAKAAGMKSVAVTYGYHPPETNFSNWNADLIAKTPEEILMWMQNTLPIDRVF